MPHIGSLTLSDFEPELLSLLNADQKTDPKSEAALSALQVMQDAPVTPVIARTEVAHAVPAWRCCRRRLPVASSCRRGKMASPSASSFRPDSGPRAAD